MSPRILVLSVSLLMLSLVVNTCSILQKPFQSEKTAHVLWHDDFEDGDMLGWEINDDVKNEIPNWFVDQGYLMQTSNIGHGKRGTNVVAGQADWTDYTLSANIVSTDDDYIGVVFRYQDPQNYYRFSLSSQISKIRLEKRVDGKFQSLGLIEEMWPECRFNMSVDVRGDSIKAYLDQQEFFAIADTSFKHGKVGFASYHNNASFLDDITVYDRLPINYAEPELEFDREPYLQSVLGDSAVVMWRTTQPQSSQVEFGHSKTDTRMVISPDPVINHELSLRGLKAGKQYFYRVSSGTLTGDWTQFRAAKPASEPFRMALYGDNRTNFLRHREIVASIADENPDIVVNTGDVVMSGLRPDWDTEFFEPMQNVIKSIPVYVAIGNHENNTLYTQKFAASPESNPIYSRYFKEYFAFPDNQHETYYSFSYGNAFFIFIDNNLAAYPDRDFPHISAASAQYRWLEEQLQSAAAQSAEWLFVTGHIPIFSAGTEEDYPLNRQYLWPLFEQYGVDMYFSGHIHDFERSHVDGICHVISGGGGGPQDHPVRTPADIRRLRTNYHYCIIEVDDSVLKLSFKDRDQNIMDELVIDKSLDNEARLALSHPRDLLLSTVEASANVPALIQLSLPVETDYNINIYRNDGVLIKHLIDGHAQAGTHYLHWNRDDADGVLVPTGIYTCRVETTDSKFEIRINI